MGRWLVAALTLLGALALTAGGYAWWQQQKPQAELRLTSEVRPVGASGAEVTTHAKARSGRLSSLRVAVVQSGKERVLLEEDLAGRDLDAAERTVTIDAEALGLEDGDAELVVTAQDDTWRPQAQGPVRLAHVLVVDTTPPAIEYRAATRNIRRAGTGIAVYKASGAVASGVRAGQREFRGVGGLAGDPDVHVALFTLPYDEEPAEPVLFARDAAGNARTSTLPVDLQPDKAVRDEVKLKDDFLRRKVPELDPKVQGDDPATLLAAFRELNGAGRRDDEMHIRDRSQDAEASGPIFRAPLKQQPNSQVMAGFPQLRNYVHDGETIDTQWHLGLDLASNAASPILAAAAGRVLWTGDNGLYGNMVLVDHGLRLVTLYAHLSSIQVSEGQDVAAAQELGRSGMTGLAAGDHLHFAVLVDGTYTNPLDWFDPKYVDDRIALPLRTAGISLPGITDVRR